MPTTTSDIPAGINRLEVQEIQVPLEGSAYESDNKDFYLKLFHSTNMSVAGPYVKKLFRTKNICKACFEICQHFMGDDAINISKYQSYSALEAAKYRGKPQHFTYETYVLIFEKNMRILSRNDKEMRYARAVQNFLSGIKYP